MRSNARIPRARWRPIWLLPGVVASLVWVAVLVWIFVHNDIGSGREFEPLLLAAVFTELAVVLSVLPHLGAADVELPAEGPTRRTLRIARRVWWALLIAPLVAIVLIVLAPPTPEAPITVPSVLAWALPLLNMFAVAALFLVIATLRLVAWSQAQSQGRGTAV